MRNIRHLLKLISDRFKRERITALWSGWLVTFWNLLPQRARWHQLVLKEVRQIHGQEVHKWLLLCTLWLLFLSYIPKIYFLSEVLALSSHIAPLH